MVITPPWAPHVGTPDCFNRPPAIGMATPVTADDTSVIFTALDGQVVTFSEYSRNATFTETDSNNGGGAAGDRRRVTGINIPHIVDRLNATSISSAQVTFSLAGDIAQPAAQALKPALKITGTVTSGTPRDPAQSSPH